jgi:hypothetical protein
LKGLSVEREAASDLWGPGRGKKASRSELGMVAAGSSLRSLLSPPG